MRGQFRGEWWTEGGSGAGAVVLLVIGAALLFGSGAAAIATAVVVALIAAAAVIVLTVAGLGAWLVCRARREQVVSRPPITITSPGRTTLPPSTARALDEPRPVEQHIHFHGLDAETIARLLAAQRDNPDR